MSTMLYAFKKILHNKQKIRENQEELRSLNQQATFI